jgi:predicted RNase H-like HicB family nuclease
MTTTDRRDEGADVRFSYEESLVTAIDVEIGVAASGDSKADALAELADALALHEGGGEEIEDEDAFLREIGLDPSEVMMKQTPPWSE